MAEGCHNPEKAKHELNGWWALQGDGRRSVRLDRDDLIASAQILAWIAMPHRPEAGVRLLEQWYWARRRFRKEALPDLPYALDKPGRLVSKLSTFNVRVLDAFEASAWFRRRVAQAMSDDMPLLKWMGATTRQLAKMAAADRGTAESNEIPTIWSRRKPVLHLATAAHMTLLEMHQDEGREAFNLERTVFQPDWVDRALESAESRARSASLIGGFDFGSFYRFHRDSF